MTTQPPGFNSGPSINFSAVHSNTDQELIQITTDKLTIILNDYQQYVDKSSDWKTPLGIVITIAIVLITTDFKAAMGLSPSTWNAIFIISLALCVFWLSKSLYNLRNKITINYVIDKIKNIDLPRKQN